MKKSILFLLIIILTFGTVYFAKSRQVFSADFEKSKVRGVGEKLETFIQEIEHIEFDRKNIPPESLENLREFIAYIFGNTPNLFFNSEAQQKWLSASLQKSIRRQLKIYEYGSLVMETPYFPDNSIFIGYWDYPTHYKIIDSRKNGENVEIDIQYIWGKGTNYEGNVGQVTFFFVHENENWKIKDIYYHEGEFNSASRLSDTHWNYWFKR